MGDQSVLAGQHHFRPDFEHAIGVLEHVQQFAGLFRVLVLYPSQLVLDGEDLFADGVTVLLQLFHFRLGEACAIDEGVDQ